MIINPNTFAQFGQIRTVGSWERSALSQGCGISIFGSVFVVVMSTLQKTILKAKLPPSVPIGSLGSRCVDPDFRTVKL